MKTTTPKTGRKAKYHVTAVSTVLAGTRFRSTIRRTIGKFNTMHYAQAFAEAQSRRPEVRNAKIHILFVIQHKGQTVAKIEVNQKGAI